MKVPSSFSSLFGATVLLLNLFHGDGAECSPDILHFGTESQTFTVSERFETHTTRDKPFKHFASVGNQFQDLVAMQESAISSGNPGPVPGTHLDTGNIPSPPEMPDAVIPVASPPQQHEESKLTLLQLLFNLWADILPHGMMPLAFGLSRGKEGPSGIIPAIGLLLLFGTTCGYSMITYAKLASSTKSKTAGEVWGKIIGRSSEWVVDLSLLSLCFGCCIFYSAFIGDIFGTLASLIRIRGIVLGRTPVLLAITAFILLPLCLLEDLSALKTSSLMGFVGIMYTAAFTIYRQAKGTYQPGSAMLEHVEVKMSPKWPTPKYDLWRIHSGTLVLANMLSLGFLAHYNAIPYYRELEDRSQYVTGIQLGFTTVMAIFCAMMFFGYSLFGVSAQPLLLNNFARSKDFGANLARLGTGLAIVSAYPLMFGALKSSLFGLLNNLTAAPDANKNKPKRPSDLDRRTQLIAIYSTIALITAIAVQCGEEDVSLILGIVGSVLGCFTAYIMPSTLRLVQRAQRSSLGLDISIGETLINWFLIAIGTLFGGLGVWITLKEEMEKRHHD